MTCPISRRSFLLGSSAMVATTGIPKASAATRHRLVAAAGRAQIVPETFAGPTPVWAFNGTAPGPVLRVRAGERLAVDVDEVDVELTFDPPWTQDMMSEEARLMTGMF